MSHTRSNHGLLQLSLYDPRDPVAEPVDVEGPFLSCERSLMERKSHDYHEHSATSDDPPDTPCLGIFPWSGPRKWTRLDVMLNLKRVIAQGLRCECSWPGGLQRLLRGFLREVERGELTTDSWLPEEAGSVLEQ